MKKRQAGILTAVLCVLLAGCSVTQSPSADLSAGPPASAAQTETPANPVKADAPPEEEPAPQGIADVYVGEWQDAEDGPSGGQCRLSIDCGANGIYGIDIRWDDSRWRFTGTYDEIWEILEPGIRSRRWTAGRYSPPPCWRRRQECFIWMRTGCSNGRIPLNTWAKI